MEISFEKKDINLRLPLPNSQYDIRLFYGVIQRICQLCKVQYFYREDEKIRADVLKGTYQVRTYKKEGGVK